MRPAQPRQPHVVMVSWRGPKHPRRGGAERYTELALEGLSDRGARVTWLVPHDSSGAATRPHGETSRDVRGVDVVPVGEGWGHVAAAARWIRRHGADVDLVVDQINGYPMLTPLSYRGPRLVLHHHRAGRIWFEHLPWPVAVIGYGLEPATLWAYRGHRTVTVSTDSADDLRRLGFRDVWIVPNAVDPPADAFQPRVTAPDPARFVTLGRLVPGKRLEHALDAFERVRDQLPEASLAIIGRGEGTYAERLLARATRTPGVEVVLDASEETKWSILGEATALVATSVREGWGISITEAHAVGTPTVAYDVPGLRSSTLHDETGLLCAATPAAAADGMLRLGRDPELWSRLSRGAERHARTMAPERLQSSFAAVVDLTLREAGRPGLPDMPNG